MKGRKKDRDNIVVPAAPTDLAGLTWQLFSGSGNPGMYMLYKQLQERGEDETDKKD